jgi:hypothetical protein
MKILKIPLIFLVVILVVLSFFSVTKAGTISLDTIVREAITAYRKYVEVKIPKIAVPTVVEVPLTETNLERFDFLVFDKSINTFEPSVFLVDRKVNPLSVYITDLITESFIPKAETVLDNNESTYVDMPIFGDNIGTVQITIKGKEVFTSDSLYLLLDNYVALPNTVNILAGTEDNLKTVLATKKMDASAVYFPKTTAQKWVIYLTYGQPLRITELRLGAGFSSIDSYKLRFLAQPNHQYGIYFDPDRRVSVLTGESGNLGDNSDVLKLMTGPSVNNLSYVIADVDGDAIPDVIDNCVSIANKDQLDINNNSRGDVCDDFDKDGIINSLDNCPNLPNYNQEDTDGDKVGDVCDQEESRLTEKHKWLPWLGIGAAFLVVIGLFIFTGLSMRKKEVKL